MNKIDNQLFTNSHSRLACASIYHATREAVQTFNLTVYDAESLINDNQNLRTSQMKDGIF